ncbi:Bug family tripartite tricarboxylate transporter substrate binding protein [Streptomyces malaysiensis]|uniref:ATP-binding protein n=1 Tax=Streptomyces autolyticus TaxID=75293 RepID=A0ABN4W484_9ACTN|nr:tripartite tricarboxylate transporter substrate binding protein [Streptomyces autolyticus]AQA11863.1 ATP-binding protein [Streptomyces autolyticus]
MPPLLRNGPRLAVVAALVATVSSACAIGSMDDSRAVADYPSRGLSILAPGSVGGGWDSRARGIGSALTSCEIIDEDVTVTNAPGAGGTIGLARMAGRGGDPYQLMTMDTVTMIGGAIQNHSPVELSELTPVAGLTVSTSAIVVPARSPFRDLRSVLAAMRKDPKKTSWVGGSLGGPDHIMVASLAKAEGVSARKVTYVPTGGGGEVLNLLLSGASKVGLSTLTELRPQIEAGKLRVLAVSGDKAPEGIDAPTLAELGYGDESVVSVGGVMAPPGLSDDEQRAIVRVVDRMRRTSCWKRALRQNDWKAVWVPGKKYGALIDKQQRQVGRALTSVGLGS